MNISPTLTGPLPALQQTSGQGTGVISSDFETFLKMLTVQMQNQDPLEPIKSEDYAVQLATFSGVEQQVRTNELMATMGQQLALMGMSQIAGWVGMEARAAVPAQFDGTPITLSPNPVAIADRAELVVRDENGQEVQRMTLPLTGENMDWAGVSDSGTPFPAGIYAFEVESYNNGALVATAPVEIYTPIAEARVRNGQTILVTPGGVEVLASDVTALRDPSLVP